MARIRSIKPEFWTSEQVMECSPNTRLMFIGMWNFADDHGRMPHSPKTIKAQIFPSDNITVENILGMLKELSSNGLIIVYAVEDKEYLQITGWHHQRIDKPQKPKCPAPFFEHSENDQGTFPPDRKGEDRKGEEKKERRASALSPGWPEDYREQFWKAFPNKVGKPRALKKLDGLARGPTCWDDLMAGLERYARTKPPDRAWLNPETFLNQERWADQPASVVQLRRVPDV